MDKRFLLPFERSRFSAFKTVPGAIAVCVTLAACSTFPSLSLFTSDASVAKLASSNSATSESVAASEAKAYIVVTPQVPAILSTPSAQPASPFYIVVPASQKVATASAEAPNPGFQLKMAPTLDSLKYAIFFEYATANLNSTGKAAVDALTQDAKVSEAIEVIGRTDATGNKLLNDKLALNRAKAVRQALVAAGVPPSKFALVTSVGNSDLGQRTALRQNIPSDTNAVSRRSDVNMAIQSKVTATAHKDFAPIPG